MLLNMTNNRPRYVCTIPSLCLLATICKCILRKSSASATSLDTHSWHLRNSPICPVEVALTVVSRRTSAAGGLHVAG